MELHHLEANMLKWFIMTMTFTYLVESILLESNIWIISRNSTLPRNSGWKSHRRQTYGQEEEPFFRCSQVRRVYGSEVATLTMESWLICGCIAIKQILGQNNYNTERFLLLTTAQVMRILILTARHISLLGDMAHQKLLERMIYTYLIQRTGHGNFCQKLVK